MSFPYSAAGIALWTAVPAVAARVDLDAPTTPPPPLPASDQQATVAELVQGITMPSDLVPLTHTSPNAGDHVVFMSTTAEAHQVGPDIADALDAMTVEDTSVEADVENAADDESNSDVDAKVASDDE